MKKTFALLFSIAVLLAGCERYDHAIQDLSDRIEMVEGASIASVEQQIAAINSSLDDLEAADAALSDYTTTLETVAKTLEEELAATDAQIAALKSELQGENAATKQALLDQLEALKSTIEADLEAINQETAALKTKDVELEGQIAALKTYVDEQLAALAKEMGKGVATEDWVKATFATLEQYDSLQTELSAIKASIEALNTAIATAETRINNKIATDIAAAISALRAEMDAAVAADIAAAVTELTTAYTEAIATAKEEITAAYTEAIATAIANSEASMKQWVNETLAQGYYDIATIDGKLAALDTKVDSLDEALTEKLAAQQAALEQAKSELTAAYKQAIETAIEDNNGVIDAAIAKAVQDVLATVDAKLATINTAIAGLQSQIDAINSTIATIEQQITNINKSIDDLEAVDVAIEALIKDLQDEAADLQQQLDANAAADTATKQALEDEIAAIKTLIADLQAKDTALDQQLAELKNYIDTKIATKEWAEATFATLTQYGTLQTKLTDLQSDLADLSTLAETNKNNLTALAAAVAALQTDLVGLETSMKQWVNETLADGYYDVAAIDGKLAALQAALDALAANGATDQELAAAIAAQQAALNQAKSDLTAAYTEAIDEITKNDGIIDTRIAAAIAAAKAELQGQLADIAIEINTIKDRLAALEGKVDALIARIQSIRFLPEFSDGKVAIYSDNSSVVLTFLLSPSAAAQAIASNPGVVTAYISRTQSITRAVDAPTAINVTKVEGTAEGMLTVTINPASLPADYWATAEDANLFIRISDGNNDVISEMIPACYTVICELPKGTIFRSAVHEQLADNTTAIKFIANSDVVTDKQIGTSPAYMQLNGTTLEIHTAAKEFVFNANCQDMFSGETGCEKFAKLTAIDFNDCINTAKVTRMSDMFFYCSALTSLDLSAFNTEKVTSMSSMFNMCHALTSLDLSSFNTANVRSMWIMFNNCYALTSLDLSKFNTANVTDMESMFNNCYALISLDIRNFDIEKVTIFTSIFSYVGWQAGTGSKTPIKVTSALHTALLDKGVSTGNYAEYSIVD